jgi:hypothetical protein
MTPIASFVIDIEDNFAQFKETAQLQRVTDIE